MACEKTPALLLEKVPFEYESKKSKLCSRSVASWLLAALLISLVVVVCIEFLYPVIERKFGPDIDSFRIYEQKYEGDLPPPVMTDYISEKEPGVVTTVQTPWDLQFLIDPVHLCDTRTAPNTQQYLENPDIKLLILVPSATCHLEQRKTIRKTWGSVAGETNSPMRLGFVLGTTKNKTEAKLIEEESAEHKDIIQADFEDTYRQLTTKSVLMLKWVARRCAHAQYLLKADDDTFVNVGIIADILGREPFASHNRFIGGYVHSGAEPTRAPEEKYYVSEDEYSDEEYPPYASGSAYVMTGPTAVELFQASKKVKPLLPMEDVFVTGLCSKQIDVPLFHDSRFRYDDPPSPPSWKTFSSLATAHSVTPDILEFVWDDMSRSILEQLFNRDRVVNATVIVRKGTLDVS